MHNHCVLQLAEGGLTVSNPNFYNQTDSPQQTTVSWSTIYVDPCCTTRMFGIETASRSQRLKGCHAFLPEGIQIEDLTQASCHA